MNRRGFFTMGAKTALAAGAAVAAVKAAAAEPETVSVVTDEALFDAPLRMEQILALPSPAVQMIPYRDMVIVACQNGEVFAVQHDYERDYLRSGRMHESG